MEFGTLLVHPFGAPFVRSVADGLRHSGMLEAIFTGLCFSKSELRYFPDVVAEAARRRTWLPESIRATRVIRNEIIRLAISRLSLDRALGWNPQRLVDAVCKQVDGCAAAFLDSAEGAGIRCVYGYEDSAMSHFKTASERGLFRCYDLPIIHHRTLYDIERREAEYYPDVASSLFSLHDSPRKKAIKDEELRMASHVVVASAVTARSLREQGYEGAVSIVPYGVDTPLIASEIPQAKRGSSEKSRDKKVLFLGRVGPRKGVHRLLEVWDRIKIPHCTLHLVGINEFKGNYLKDHLKSAIYHGPANALSVSQLLVDTDLLVLPSLAEGFGLVLLEALAHGIPVLATDLTALPEILEKGECGVVIPSGDNEALAAALERILKDHDYRDHLACHSRKVAAHYSWSKHAEQIASIVKQGCLGLL